MDAFTDRDLGLLDCPAPKLKSRSCSHVNGKGAGPAELLLQTRLGPACGKEQDTSLDGTKPHSTCVLHALHETLHNNPFALHSLQLRVWLTPAPGKLAMSYLSQNANTFKTNTCVPVWTSLGCFMHG